MPRGRPTAAVAERPAAPPKAPERQSERGRRMREEVVLRPLDQIRQIPGGNGVEATGAWSYFIRPDGATIRDALVLYPNGGIPEMDNERLRARYGTNAEYYRQRQANKGLEYVGPHLREAGIKRLLEVLAANREDEMLFCQEEIADAKDTMKNADVPEIRQQARRRVRQYERRLETLRNGFNPDELAAELNDIARAQQLAQVPPAVLRVMRSMIGDVNDRVASMATQFSQGKPRGEAAPSGGMLRSGGGDKGTEFDA